MTRDEIKDAHPMEATVLSYGLVLAKRTQTGFMVKCPFHDDKNPSMSIDTTTNLFKCFGCQAAGSVIDFVARMDGIPIGEAMTKLGGPRNIQSRPAPVKPSAPVSKKIVATYSYKDELGNELFQSVRIEPKDFMQRYQKDGKWVWNLQGIRRVLYNLPLILKANSNHIWIVEGEKDCDNMRKCQFVATTCPMGAGKWSDGYNQHLAGKEIILCGDNDDIGRKHVQQVLESICKVVKTIRRIEVPSPFKDVSEFIASFPDYESAARELYNLYEGATVLTQGVEVPVQNKLELEREYEKHVKDCRNSTLDLSKWLPSLKQSIRGLVPGEMMTILAGTSVGKTACLQNIAIACKPIPTLMFELELPSNLTFERFAALSEDVPATEIFTRYNEGTKIDWTANQSIDHMAWCSKSRLDVPEIERIILQSELKTGMRPVVVLLDYIGLVQSLSKSRYEKLSDIAEGLRVMAKVTKTIIILACQISRKKPDDSPEVSITDAKDSGSIENSSSVLVGAWRDAEDKYKLVLKVLKNTRGPTGQIIETKFNGLTMKITERSKIDQADIPQRKTHNALQSH